MLLFSGLDCFSSSHMYRSGKWDDEYLSEFILDWHTIGHCTVCMQCTRLAGNRIDRLYPQWLQKTCLSQSTVLPSFSGSHPRTLSSCPIITTSCTRWQLALSLVGWPPRSSLLTLSRHRFPSSPFCLFHWLSVQLSATCLGYQKCKQEPALEQSGRKRITHWSSAM